MKKAQMKISYNAENDEFILWTRAKGETEWGFCIGCKCTRSERQDENDEPEYVYFGILTALQELASRGYELTY